MQLVLFKEMRGVEMEDVFVEQEEFQPMEQQHLYPHKYNNNYNNMDLQL